MPPRRLSALADAHVEALADLLIACVDGGASISFLPPLPRDRARAFWAGLAPEVAAGARALLVAEDGLGICGTVQLGLAQPENQVHRADLAKLLVHPRARRRGVGGALVRAAEDVARAEGKALLVLDTETGSAASRMYARLGWVRVGDIPGFARDVHGGPVSTTYYYRALDAAP